jgi:hypothetical protein
MTSTEGANNGNTAVDYEDALRRLALETDAYELQALWSTGIELASSPEERDRVLAAAGRQLRHLLTSDPGPSQLDRVWLRHLAQEVVFRGPEVSDELIATASTVMRDTVFEADDAIQEWLASQRNGEPILAFVRRLPKYAAILRDLGRLTQRLRPAGVTSLIDPVVVEGLQAFSRALGQLPTVLPGAVPAWMRVTRDELKEWAGAGTAPQVLPELVRRLVLESGDHVTSLHFPAGSGVASGGWDGVVEAGRASLFVPAGPSGWELSTKTKSHNKAIEDFKNRVESTPPDQRAQMAYVQVICRPWAKRSEFLHAAIEEAAFREVRAYNLDDIETWLEQAPATSVWFKEQTGRPLTGARTIEDVWRNWLESTVEPLDESVVLAGRRREVDELSSRVSAGPGVTTIGGDVRLDEIQAFVGAAAQQEADTGRLNSIIVVDNAEVARRVFETPVPVVVLATNPDHLNFVPPASPHHVVVAVPSGERVDVELGRIDSAVVTEYFRKVGVEIEEAGERGELARRSLLALRRLLAKQPERHRPNWAEGATLEVRRSALLQVWNRERDSDKNAVERILGEPYVVAEERLHQLRRSADDPFIAILDDRWHVVSPTDAWLLLSTQITPDDIDHFVDVAVEVLIDVDPVSQLADDDRWRASLDDLTPTYSGHIRRGIARTVAMFGAIESSAEYGSGRTSVSVARDIVRRVLRAANADASFATWTSVAPYLSLLIEAAPLTAIDELRNGLEAVPPLMKQMFRDDGVTKFGSPKSSPHIQFVWALETLAWSPEYFADAIELMADLATLDPGGRWSNRPKEALGSILCPWHPNTSASADQQIHAANRLRGTHPNLAWDVLVSLLPDSFGAQMLSRGPEFRSWKAGEVRVLTVDFTRITIAAARALVEDAGSSVERWVTLIKKIDDIHPDVQIELRSGLERLAGVLTAEPDRRVIWDSLREFLARHREHADAKWALPESLLAQLDPIVGLFEPVEPQLKYGWLFAEGMVRLGDRGRRNHYAEYEAELWRRRGEAVAEILVDGGLSAVLSFAESAAIPDQIGVALAAATQRDDFDQELVEMIGAADEVQSSIAFAYFGYRFRERGWPYLEALVDQASPVASARLLRSSREPIEASVRADSLGQEVTDAFWREFNYFGLGQDLAGVVDLARRLQGAGRFAAALGLLALYLPQNDSVEFAEAIADALEGLRANQGSDPDVNVLREYDFDVLLSAIAKYRDAIGRDRAIRLEWFFLPALGFDPDAPNLHRALAEEPSFFVEMVKLVYRPRSGGDERPAPTEEDRRAAENAFRLLHAWKTCPGTAEDGTLDVGALNIWVSEARLLLKDADRTDVGDNEIGQALVAASPDGEGWPPKAVKHLIQKTRSDQLDRGFGTKVFNNRGVVSRSLDAGGKSEWKLAADFRAQAEANRARWPRVARIFDRLADTYEADARHEDARAERRRRGLD